MSTSHPPADTPVLIQRHQETKDSEAALALLDRYGQRLEYTVSFYERYGADADDLRSACTVAFLKALDQYDLGNYSDIGFSQYVWRSMNIAARTELQKGRGPVACPVKILRDGGDVVSTVLAYRFNHHLPAGQHLDNDEVQLLAEYLMAKPSLVAEIDQLAAGAETVSHVSDLADEPDYSYDIEDTDWRLDAAKVTSLAERMADELDDRDRKILDHLIVRGPESGDPLLVLTAELNITKSAIYQRADKILQKLRSELKIEAVAEQNRKNMLATPGREARKQRLAKQYAERVAHELSAIPIDRIKMPVKAKVTNVDRVLSVMRVTPAASAAAVTQAIIIRFEQSDRARRSLRGTIRKLCGTGALTSWKQGNQTIYALAKHR